MPEAKGKSEPACLRDKAVAYLSRREHSRFELTRKLERAGFDLGDINPVLDDLEGKDWLSDRRFAEAYVRAHSARKGSTKLANDLRLRGVTELGVAAALLTLPRTEEQRAFDIWLRKFKAAPANPAESQKHMRFLYSRGFSPEVILKVMKGIKPTCT